VTDERPDDFGFGDGGFCKLYGDRLAASSLLECAVASRWIFLYMLARADSQGRFRCATAAGLARAAAVSLPEAESALRELEAPDPHSSTPDEEGRRILRIAGGWQIVTYAKYRDFRTKRQLEDARRQRAHRGRMEDELASLRKGTRQTRPPAEPSACDMSHDVTVTSAPDVRR
jgi:hypothetical protein